MSQTESPLYGPGNPHPLSKMRTELVWDGKYDEYGNRREVDVAACALPMQKIETVDEPRQRAAATGNLELFDKQFDGKRHDDFRNRLIWGDNKLVMASLLKEFKGKIDLIYIDPPFDVGADFTMNVPIGDGKETVGKDQSTLEMVAYRDMWGKGTDSYLHMMQERLSLMKELLSEKGNIYVHCDWRVSFFMRLLLDEVFSAKNFRNEIMWFEPYFSGADRRMIPHYHQLAQNLRKTLVYRNGVSPLGLLRNCLDYALNDHTKLTGVFEAVKTEFRFDGGRNLLDAVKRINDFRNTRVAHQESPLVNSDEAKDELIVWVEGLVELWCVELL